MLNNPFLRLLIALGIAIPIVYALFMMMSYLISVKEVKLDQSEQRVLSAITPQQQDADVRVRQRSKPKRIDSAQKPPPPPKVSATKSQINLPTPRIEGAAPQFLTGMPSQSVRQPRLIRNVRQSVARKAAVMFASMWIHAVVRTTSLPLAQIVFSSGKQNGLSARLNLLRRSFAVKRPSVAMWYIHWSSNWPTKACSTTKFEKGAPGSALF